MNPIPCPHCDGHGSYPVPNPKRNDPFRTDPFPCERCNSTGYVNYEEAIRDLEAPGTSIAEGRSYGSGSGGCPSEDFGESGGLCNGAAPDGNAIRGQREGYDPDEIIPISTSDPEHPYSGHSSLWPSGSLASFTEELAAQLAAMPHHRQAMVLAFPNGVDARELAANTVRAMEERGIRV